MYFYNNTLIKMLIKNEIRTEVKVFYVELQCNKCKTGKMIRDFSKPVLMSNPEQINHKCDYCGFEEYLQKCYPYQDLVNV